MNARPALIAVVTLEGVDHYALQPLGTNLEPEILCNTSWAIDVDFDRAAMAATPCLQCQRHADGLIR